MLYVWWCSGSLVNNELRVLARPVVPNTQWTFRNLNGVSCIAMPPVASLTDGGKSFID